VQIYDPATAQLVNGVVTRQPFPGNVIPASRINPIAANILKYFPAPNAAAAADLSSNYFIEQPWTYGYDFQMVRIDHEWAQNHRTYGRFIRNFRREERFNFAGVQNGTEITRGSTDRFNYNWAGGHTAVLSPTMVLDLKGSWLRFNDDLFPLYDIDYQRSATRRPRSGCSAISSNCPATASSRRTRRPRAASPRSARSRAASTTDARSRSTTCSSQPPPPRRRAPTR
jgi:hypothetical protein